MADGEHQPGGPSTARRRKHSSKSKPQPSNDWPRSGELRPRASPRPKRQGDIDMDIVETSDDANDANASPRKQRRRRRRQPPSSTASDTSATTKKTPHRSLSSRSESMRVPNASVPVLDRTRSSSHHRRPTCVIEEADDDDVAPSGPSRPVSRQTIARRDPSPRSAHRYRSTPESRRSPRTSVSDSEDDTDATSNSDEEQVIQPRGKHPPPVPMAPAVPAAPKIPIVRTSLQERLTRQPEMVYEEGDDDDGEEEEEEEEAEEFDVTSRYARSVRRHRSLSRAPSSRRDQYRRPRDISVSGPPSLDETRSRSRSRMRLRRHYDSDVFVSRPSSSHKKLHATSSHSLSSSAKRSTFFPPFAAAPTVHHPSPSEKPVERLTTCVSCANDRTPVSQTAKLKCLHRMCNSCLHRAFKVSLTDPREMPPRCCTADLIPVEHVENLFDASFKREWNQKFLQHATRNRIYCPSRRCGEWIRPEDIRREGGRKYARCSRCRIKVCGSCSGRWHHQPDCPRDDETAQLVEQARRNGRQRCRRCTSVVELQEGHDHITCRCGAEFCMICGGKWKTCECPWFKYDPLEADLTRRAMDSRQNPFAAGAAYESRPPSAHDFRSDFGPSPAASLRPRPASYEDEAYLRRLHQRDDHLTRRMHSFDAFGHHGDHADFDRSRGEYEFDEPCDRRRRRAEHRGYSATLVEDEYHRRAATVVAPSPPQLHVPAAPAPPRSAFEPPSSRPVFDRAASAFDYPPATPRNRGLRYESPENYDDYLTENYKPERRRTHSPEPWPPFSQERRSRSHGRRRAYSADSRPASPETWQQLPTRFPSPERPTPAPEERQRAPSLERRRASSLERRLADRFKPESRQSPAAPTVPVPPVTSVGPLGTVGPVGPLGAAGPMGPLSPTRAPPPPSRSATHPAGMGMPPPMAHVPPPPPHPHGPPPPSLRRHHTMDEDLYVPTPGMGPMHPHPHASMSPANWFGPPPPPGPGLAMHHHSMPPFPHHPHPHALHDMMIDGGGLGSGTGTGTGGSPRAPNVKRRPPQAHKEHSKYEEEVPRSSVLAGLGGIGRGPYRVEEWVNWIEPGVPPEGDAATMAVQ
ncbi:hypothetical protein VTK26DRAFT_7284 [Humicola hyalothermophila]